MIMYHVLIAVARSARLDHCLNFTHLVKPNAFRFTQIAGIRTSHLHCVPRRVRPLAWTKTSEGNIVHSDNDCYTIVRCLFSLLYT